MDNVVENNKPLNQASVKYILIFLMALDHIAHFLGEGHPLYLPFRIVSRLTGPIMAYFIAEGYHYTRDVKKYALRLFIFALISHIPFVLFEYNDYHTFLLVNGKASSDIYLYLSSINKTLIVHETSVIYTLLLGLLSIMLWDKARLPKWLKLIIQIVILWLSFFGDWSFGNVLFCLIFYFLKNDKKKMWLAYILVCLTYIFNIYFSANPFNMVLEPGFYLYRVGTLLVIPFVELLYNGKPGKKSFINKWFFYIFYPAHLLIIHFIFR